MCTRSQCDGGRRTDARALHFHYARASRFIRHARPLNYGARRTILGRRALVIPVLAVTVIASGCADVLTVCRERVVGDTYFVGLVNRVTGQAKYVRMFYQQPTTPSTIPPPVYVRVGSQTAVLDDAIPSSLSAAGFPELPSHRPAVRTFGVNCRRPNVEAFLEFTFVDDRLRFLGAMGFAEEVCDFWVGWEPDKMFSLPVSGQDLDLAVPIPGSFRACTPAF